MKTNAPYSPTLRNLAIPFAAIVPKAVVEADEDAFILNPVGSGPYCFVEWKQGDHVTLKAFDDYYAGKAATENLIMKVIKEVKNMRLANLTWPKAQEYFEKNDMVLISIGSIECHGRHMPLGTDTLIPDFLLEKIEQKSDVLIAPTIPYGACQCLAPYPGTIDIDNEVLYQFCRQIFLSLYRHGARKFVFLNGHGGNMKMIERLGLEFEDKGCLVAMLNWWLMAWDMNPAWKGGHGGGEETAAILGIDPSLVDKSEIGGELQFKHLTENLKTTGFRSVEYKGVSVEILRNTPHVTDSGWIGPDHPSTATEEWGKEMLETTANYIVDFMEEFKKVKLS